MEHQEPEVGMSAKSLFEVLPSEDEEDCDFEALTSESDSDDEPQIEQVPAEEVANLALETLQLQNNKRLKSKFLDLDLNSDDSEEYTLIESESQSDSESSGQEEDDDLAQEIQDCARGIKLMNKVLKSGKVFGLDQPQEKSIE